MIEYTLDNVAQVMSLNASPIDSPNAAVPSTPPAYSCGLRIGEHELLGESCERSGRSVCGRDILLRHER